MVIKKSQIYEWIKVFIETHYDEGYPVELEDVKGVFYPRHWGESDASEEGLSNVEIKGDFLIEGEEEQQQVTAYFKLHPQKEGPPIWEFLRMD